MKYLLNGVIKDKNKIDGFLVGIVDNEQIKITGAPMYVKSVSVDELKNLCLEGDVEYINYNRKSDRFEVEFTEEHINKYKDVFNTFTLEKLSTWSGYIDELPHFKLSDYNYAIKSNKACGTILNLFVIKGNKKEYICKLALFGTVDAIQELKTCLFNITHYNDKFIKFGDNFATGYLPLSVCTIFCDRNQLVLDTNRINKNELFTKEENMLFELPNKMPLSDIRFIKRSNRWVELGK